jgi:hypothetical protein
VRQRLRSLGSKELSMLMSEKSRIVATLSVLASTLSIALDLMISWHLDDTFFSHGNVAFFVLVSCALERLREHHSVIFKSL